LKTPWTLLHRQKAATNQVGIRKSTRLQRTWLFSDPLSKAVI